ncbi:Sugar diacid utilization regulator [[Clostridium] ultunense Esp]|nr:Sugar diacid utilization regulator [[Clostridium] ultunense Esp]
MLYPFTKELAQEIVERTMKILGRNINVMDREGVIIGSGDKERIGDVHEGALLVLKENKTVEIDERSVWRLNGVKMGINLPIHFLGETVGVIGITGHPDDIREYAHLVKMAAELVLQQSFFLEQGQWKQRLTEELINQLIFDDHIEEERFLKRAKTLGIDLSLPRFMVVIETPEQQIRFFRVLTYELEQEDVAAFTYASEIAVLKWAPHKEKSIGDVIHAAERWARKMPGGKIGIGPYGANIGEFRYSYTLAKQAVKIGRKIYPNERVYYYENIALEMVLSHIGELPLAKQFFSFYEELLCQDETGELQETLSTYIEEKGELNKTANKLFIHRNTLRYRLEKIRRITGKDPYNAKDLLQLYAALIIYRLR